MNINSIKLIFAQLFTFIFLALTLSIIFILFKNLLVGFLSGDDITQVFLSSINTSIIGLAVFELALVVNKEYAVEARENDDPVASVRRTIPRFIGTVCIALSLEGLIMVIKYSQLELAGNLYYPVAIIASTALLLAALGLFLRMTRDDKKTG